MTLSRIRDLLAVARAMLHARQERARDEFVVRGRQGPIRIRDADADGQLAETDHAGSSTSELMAAVKDARAELERSGVVIDAAAVIAADDGTILEPCAPDIAPHVIAPCSTCGAPARAGAVHYPSLTEQRPCPASWGRSG